MKITLNIGAGKVSPRTATDEIFVNLDRGYPDFIPTLSSWSSGLHKDSTSPGHYFVKQDIFEFMDSYPFKFDYIIANRIFEHMEYVGDKSVGRLLEACHKILTRFGEMEIVVPNAALLASELLEYEAGHIGQICKNSDNLKLVINTEFTNSCHEDPHCSIWTPRLAREYIEQEGTFSIIKIEDQITFANREIYMKILLKKKGDQ